VISRQEFFEGLAAKWDLINPPAPQAAAIDRGLDLVEPLSGAQVVDVGCGTGAVTGRLLLRLGEGRATALDFAPAMVERAAVLHPDPRVLWRTCDVLDTGFATASASVVLCYNSFPHFPEPALAAAELSRWLRPGGRVLVWHDKARAQIAEVHRRVGGPVGADAPLPVEELAAHFASAGLRIDRAEEPAGTWLLLASRPA
jgi:ubiquinone/menaquinone biosynthesis C-methylase UbiE